jgi:hypothetical protein
MDCRGHFTLFSVKAAFHRPKVSRFGAVHEEEEPRFGRGDGGWKGDCASGHVVLTSSTIGLTADLGYSTTHS